MNVSNHKCIRRLSVKNMIATKARNVIAITAIALTTLLFTALFTIVMSISKGTEQFNFQTIGTYAHGGFKNISEEVYNILKEDEAIKNYGLQRVVGFGSGEVFLKNYTEIEYMDKNAAEWCFVMPTTGRMPKEGTNEAAADTQLLKLLGVPLELGAEFSVTMNVDGTETTESFVLSGWWESGLKSQARRILIPQSRVDEIFNKLNTQFLNNNYLGKYMVYVMLKDSRDIEAKMREILARNGFSTDVAADNYISVSVNGGYMNESMLKELDGASLLSLGFILLLIIFTGYLIIYNIFCISVSNEIRHYGMLKTIGTTGKQIRRIILIQAMVLAAIGIPLGMLGGYGMGALLTPIVASELNGVKIGCVSTSPVIFVFSAVFAFVTVLISCFKPGRMAAAISPIEALRYTEASSKKMYRAGKKGSSIWRMSIANLARNKGKVALTILSLSLSVILFTIVITFTNSLSLEKWLSDSGVDFQVSCAEYFNAGVTWSEETAMDEAEIDVFLKLEGLTGGGITYGTDREPCVLYDESAVRERMQKMGRTEEEIAAYLEHNVREHENNKVFDDVQLLGMDEYCANKLEVEEGDISRLYEEANTIAVESNSSFDVGDVVVVSYLDKVEIVNTQTGKVYSDVSEVTEDEFPFLEVKRSFHEKEYTIVAKVKATYGLGYRYYYGEEFYQSKEEMVANIPDAKILYYVFDVEDDAEAQIEEFMASYTENSALDYTSKAIQIAEFHSFKRMFLILSGTLCFVMALVGMLNFINIVLTGIVSRKKELATLQAIGMTGNQLRKMLIFEGIFYTGGAAMISVILSVATIPMASALEEIFWFCEYRFTMLPILITVPVFAGMGILVPTITYRQLAKKTVVERLRETE